MTGYGLDNKGYEFELEDVRKGASKNDALKNPSFPDKTDKNVELGDAENRCGLGCFNPEWAQRFATKRAFMVVFTLLGVIQGMTWSYFTATISTLEKRFKISSETAGVVMTGNEISQILFSIFLSHYGGKGHRPRWIAVGVFFSSLACFVLASPHFFYGSGLDALVLTEEFSWMSQYNANPQIYLQMDNGTGDSVVLGGQSTIIQPIYFVTESYAADIHREPMRRLEHKIAKVSLCERTAIHTNGNCEDQNTNLAPLVLIFLSQFVAGIGVLLFFTLGGPYLDDNTKRKNIAMLFGITMSLRLVGPTFGFLVASGALKMYVNPLLTPIITPEDPRWTGAWWLGWVVFGSMMMVFSFVIGLFPRKLRRGGVIVSPEGNGAPETIPILSEIPGAIKLLLKNKVNVFNNLAGVFYLFAAIGYWTYMPKYMETIFMQTASNASVVSGAVGIFSQATGMLLSGYLISRFQFSARKLAAWNVFTGFSHVALMIGFTQIGCDGGNVSFGTEQSDGTWNLRAPCNQDCNCKTSKILPVCYKQENIVFYSACHAGCETYDSGRIGNCSCIANESANVILGNCSTGCGQIFMIFLIISAFIKFVDATGRIGNMLVSYRCVKLEERSLSIGLNVLLLSALAFLPGPIVFGRIIDSVCLVWGGSQCGKRGNCMLYNGKQLRYIFNVFAAGFVFVGVLFDLLVWYFVKDLDLYTEPDSNEETEKNAQEKK